MRRCRRLKKLKRKERYVLSVVFRKFRSPRNTLPAAARIVVAGILDLDAGRRGAESRAGSKRTHRVGDRRGTVAFSGRAHLLFRGPAETQTGARVSMTNNK